MERFYYSSSTSAVYASSCNAVLWITKLYSTFRPLKANRQCLNVNFFGANLSFKLSVQLLLFNESYINTLKWKKKQHCSPLNELKNNLLLLSH